MTGLRQDSSARFILINQWIGSAVSKPGSQTKLVTSGEAVQSDGKLVIAGETDDGPGGAVASFEIVRFDTNNVLDLSFGAGGVVFTSFGPESDYQAGNNTILNPDKLVIAGDVNYPMSYTFGIVRLNLNGTLDTTFGNGGNVTNVFRTGAGGARGTAVVVQGFSIHPRKITVGGFGTGGFGLARFNADGSLDSTFGSGTGKVTVPVSPVGQDQVSGMTFQGGKLVLVGDSFENASSPWHSVISAVRFNSDGSVDGTFGSGGVVTADVASPSGAQAVVVQPDGKLGGSGGCL